jgi:hypothetical protein
VAHDRVRAIVCTRDPARPTTRSSCFLGPVPDTLPFQCVRVCVCMRVCAPVPVRAWFGACARTGERVDDDLSCPFTGTSSPLTVCGPRSDCCPSHSVHPSFTLPVLLLIITNQQRFTARRANVFARIQFSPDTHTHTHTLALSLSLSPYTRPTRAHVRTHPSPRCRCSCCHSSSSAGQPLAHVHARTSTHTPSHPRI